MTWSAIAGFRRTVGDLDRATAFYDGLGFAVGPRPPIAPDEMSLFGLDGTGLRQTMTLGPSRLDLDAFSRPGQPYPSGADAAWLGFQHLALVTSDAALFVKQPAKGTLHRRAKGTPVTAEA